MRASGVVGRDGAKGELWRSHWDWIGRVRRMALTTWAPGVRVAIM